MSEGASSLAQDIFIVEVAQHDCATIPMAMEAFDCNWETAIKILQQLEQEGKLVPIPGTEAYCLPDEDEAPAAA